MRRLRALATWLLLAALLGAALWLERGRLAPQDLPSAAPRVIDGDSFRMDGREIRLAGIDAPEYRQTCQAEGGQPWPCGKEARAALEGLVAAPSLRCTREAEDRYGRALAHCRTAAGDVGREMARLGWALGARDARFPEPAREISQAKAARRGIWRGMHQHPADWRKANPRA
jgi:endonuclease YncB( thermonuclease family)